MSLGGVVLMALGAAGVWWRSNPAGPLAQSPKEVYVPRPPGTLTYCKDVAPIIQERCARCHRPGQSAPFNLLSYTEVKKHARQIAEVTERRYMPPWLPEPGYGHFAGERRLTTQELGTLQQWIREGTPEGDPAQLTPPRTWTEGWQLGVPDLVVDLPAYTLPGEGKDIYRNLVVPIPVSSTKFVKGAEFLPGNPRVVHHAFINIDETRQSRRLAEKQNPPGFDGMDMPESAIMPGGQLLGWQPGKQADLVEDGLAWVLKPNTDLVLQMHLHPTGKPEVIRAKVGFYFTDQSPTTVPYRIRLVRFDFEIPPGASNYLVEQSYVLPVDVSLRRILPHCHYLGKDLQAYALLPNGEKRWLIWIKDWDFNWQGDYKFAEPVELPKGSRLVMHYTYDNSTNNPRNPHSPPVTVRHGLQTTDEMAALALQAVVRTPQDRALLAQDYFNYFRRVSMDYYEFRLRNDPNDVEAHTKLARALFSLDRTEEALAHLTSAVRIKPTDDRPHYELGFIYLRQQRLREAFQEFQTVIQLNPEDHEAYGSLGYICLAAGKKDAARAYLEAALRLNPDDQIARDNLERANALPER
jgi:Flp pilus assembly protein TadD